MLFRSLWMTHLQKYKLTRASTVIRQEEPHCRLCSLSAAGATMERNACSRGRCLRDRLQVITPGYSGERNDSQENRCALGCLCRQKSDYTC